MAIQEQGDTVIMKENVGHTVLTVSGIPGWEFGEGSAGAALLTSTVDQGEPSTSLRRTRQTEWLLPTGETEGASKVPGAAKKRRKPAKKFGRVERRNKKQ